MLAQLKRFRIYYGDGSTYSGNPFYAPARNVICIIMEDTSEGRGWRLVRTEKTHRGYYCWWPEIGWLDHDQAGFYDYLYHCDGPTKVIFGHEIRTEDYWMIVGRATGAGLG